MRGPGGQAERHGVAIALADHQRTNAMQRARRTWQPAAARQDAAQRTAGVWCRRLRAAGDSGAHAAGEAWRARLARTLPSTPQHDWQAADHAISSSRVDSLRTDDARPARRRLECWDMLQQAGRPARPFWARRSCTTLATPRHTALPRMRTNTSSTCDAASEKTGECRMCVRQAWAWQGGVDRRRAGRRRLACARERAGGSASVHA